MPYVLSLIQKSSPINIVIVIIALVIVSTTDKYCIQTHLLRFGTEKKCHDYLVECRWKGQPQCPSCNNNHLNYYLSSRNIYKCSKCYKQFSVTQGTIFHRSKVPLTKWFLAIYIFTTKKRGVSSIQLSEWIDVTQHTAWYMLHRLREALKEENDIVLGGIVEADETFVTPKVHRDLRLKSARRKHEEEQNRIHGYTDKKRRKLGDKRKRGRKKGSTKEVLEQKKMERGGASYTSTKPSNRTPFEKGAVVLGMIEQRGKVVMKKLGVNSKCVTRENIFPYLEKHISSDSVFVTDALNLYDTTSELFAEHRTVNHEVGYVVNDIHINNIENAWKHLKKMIDGTYFHTSYHHFDGYLSENTYRWNRREESKKSLVEDFFQLIGKGRVTYKQLKERKGQKLAA